MWGVGVNRNSEDSEERGHDEMMRRCAVVVLQAVLFMVTDALRVASPGMSTLAPCCTATRATIALGLFDSLSKAFANEEFKEDDQRVRASHILIKGDDDLDTIVKLMGELGERVQSEPDRLLPIFAEIARRESQCSSAAQGGDLGLFGPGKMVAEFDDVLFPNDAPPPPGSLLGPVVTDFGCHLILVTKREVNKDQVEEKLARND
jgi:hypothetical protein